MAMLAKWFHFQPEQIDRLTLVDFYSWVEQANQQIAAQNLAAKPKKRHR